jgi:AbrB family looped-hinge helix DNA binding protein
MVKLRLKVGPKGQIVIPKILREKYGIRENGYVLVDVREGELAITKAPSVDETLEWIRLRRARLRARQATLGELSEMDLEEEFDEDLRGRQSARLPERPDA